MLGKIHFEELFLGIYKPPFFNAIAIAEKIIGLQVRNNRQQLIDLIGN